MATTYPAGTIAGTIAGRPAIEDYREARVAFAAHQSLHSARLLMEHGTCAWASGWIGDATYVREALEPVRTYLLAGNTPMPEGR